jgi:hypothetical protein
MYLPETCSCSRTPAQLARREVTGAAKLSNSVAISMLQPHDLGKDQQSQGGGKNSPASMLISGKAPHEVTRRQSLPNEHRGKRGARRDVETRFACHAGQVLGDINAQPGS